MIIYKTTNKVNGKIYIGQDSRNRKDYLGSGYILRKAIKLYGRENFTKEILCTCLTREELNVMEKHYIKSFNSRDPNVGYNLTCGGQGGPLRLGAKLSLETKEKIAASVKSSYDDAARERISKQRKGSKTSEETKKKLSDSHKHLRWISKLETKETLFVPENLVKDYLSKGWIKGRKFNNAFVKSN